MRSFICPQTEALCEDGNCIKDKICVEANFERARARKVAEVRAAAIEHAERQRIADTQAAAWQVIRDIADEHIAANKSSLTPPVILVMQDKNGNLIARLRHTELGLAPKKKHQDLISSVLASKNPDTIRRLRSAMNAIVAEKKKKLAKDDA